MKEYSDKAACAEAGMKDISGESVGKCDEEDDCERV